jgi:hypothetical protein
MAKLRDPNLDGLKGSSVLKGQVLNNIQCKLEDCFDPISIYDGPGSACLCRNHQLQCVEYGGQGKAERPHTFYKGWVCKSCSYDPREDPTILEIDDPFDQLRVMRGVMHGDHIELKSQGGGNSAKNIQTLCCRCHMIKTYKEKDYLGKKQLDIVCK